MSSASSHSPPELPAELPPGLRAKILGSTAAVPAPTQSEWQLRSVVVTGVGVAVSLAMFAAIGGVELGRRPAIYVAVLGAAWAALLLVVSPWALGRGRSSVGRSSKALGALSLALPVLIVGAMGAAALAWPETLSIDDDRSDIRCFVVALALGAGPYAAFLWVKRRLVLVHPHVEAAAAGVFAGTLGALLITLRCDCSELGHLVLGHVLPVLTLGVGSALVAGRWFARAPLSA